MGDLTIGLAATLAERLGLRVPLHPFFVARALGLEIFAANGMRDAACIVDGAVYFDDSHDDWRPELASVVCGEALRRAGLSDDARGRRELASALGFCDCSSGEQPSDDAAPDIRETARH